MGLKITLMLQLPDAASVEPQVVVSEKSPLFVPVIEIPVMLSEALPVLDSVTA